MDEAVLTELRAIRAEIRTLADKLAQTATREELGGYVRREEFEMHQASHRSLAMGWQRWVPVAISAVALLLMLLSAAGVHLVMG